jgi:DNA-binding response OmpR family regulator
MPSVRGAISGLKLLLVEDNFLVAEHMREMLERHGCDVVGPAPRVTRALELVQEAEALDGAMLDLNLNGELCFPVARALAARGVPFLFLTGYEAGAIIPEEFETAPIVPKPVDERGLMAAIRNTFRPCAE